LRLAVVFLRRQGALPPDEGEALRWFRASAEDGNRQAMEAVGRMYQKGQGTPRDDSEAAKWFRRGAEAGQRDAMREIARAYHLGAGVERDEAESKRWSKAADDDAARAKRALDRGADPPR
jgi:TPR repeat protein